MRRTSLGVCCLLSSLLIFTAQTVIAQTTSIPAPSPPTYILDQSLPLTQQSAGLIETGDFNGDGKPDIAASFQKSDGSYVAIFIGNGDGAMTRKVDLKASGSSFVAGDFNGDGKVDLASANGSTISVFPGSGDGTFQAAIKTNTSGSVGEMRSGDFDADGRLDLAMVVADSAKAIRTLLGNGDGTFRQGSSVNNTVQAMVVADFNRDGRSDVGTISADPGQGQLTVFLAGPGGALSPAFVTDFPHAWGVVADERDPVYGRRLTAGSLAAADLNRDGSPDLAVIDWPGVSTFLGDGHGGFGAPVVSAIDLFDDTGATAKHGLPLTRARVGDINGDGLGDLVLVDSYQKQLLVVYGTGDGKFLPAKAFGPLTGEIALSDFNGDGKSDVALNCLTSSYELVSPSYALVSRPTAMILLATVKGTLNAIEETRIGYSGGGAFADFNGDGITDFVGYTSAAYTSVAVAQTPSRATIVLSAPKQTFRPAYLPADLNSGLRLVPVDFNDDGRVDLATYNGADGTLRVALGNGNGAFGPAASYSWQPPQSGSLLAADFNGDHIVDLALLSSASITVRLNNGDGTLGLPVQTQIANTGLVLADFNGDGKIDIALIQTSSPPATVRVLLGLGNGTFSPAVESPLGTDAVWDVAAGDLNGDGKDDLVLTRYRSDNIWVLIAGGQGSFLPSVKFPAGIAAGGVVIADFDGDHRKDVAVTNLAEGLNTRYGPIVTTPAISMLRGDGAGGFGAPVTWADASSRMPVRALDRLVTGDFDGDGRTDVSVTVLIGDVAYLVSPRAIVFNQGRFSATVPAIGVVQPARGPAAGGQVVTLDGHGLNAATAVQIGGITVTPTSDTPDLITFTTPPHAARAVAVRVTTRDGEVVSTYTYIGTPVASSLSPALGVIAGGGAVVINGSALEEAAVTFGGIPVTVTQNTGTTLTVMAPPHAAGRVDIVITTPGGTTTMSGAYQYLENAAIPTVSIQLLALLAAVLAAVAWRTIRT